MAGKSAIFKQLLKRTLNYFSFSDSSCEREVHRAPPQHRAQHREEPYDGGREPVSRTPREVPSEVSVADHRTAAFRRQYSRRTSHSVPRGKLLVFFLKLVKPFLFLPWMLDLRGFTPKIFG